MSVKFKLLIPLCLFFLIASSLSAGKDSHWISNADSIFESTPKFHIQSDHYAERIHWQVSDSKEFDWISPDLYQTSTSLDEIIFTEEAQKLLIPGETYYFRFKTEFNNKFSSWSKPFQFSLGTPKTDSKEYTWQKSNFIDEWTWNRLLPYLLPSNHPIKSKLDHIFSEMRATANPSFMKKAGFEGLGEWRWNKVYVARHPKLKGYLIKAYLDNHLLMDDKLLVNRIIGAEALRCSIHAYAYQSLFKVPRKWLYQLPDYPGTLQGLQRKNFILVVEDMDLVSKEKNKKMYQTLSEKKLLPLFNLINSLGLADSIYIKNIPFSKDGKIAFVDLEIHHLWPVPFQKLTPVLNPELKNYWHSLFK